jgi:hypothetical protein
MNLSVVLNENALCRYDDNLSAESYDEMQGEFGSENLYLLNQTLNFQVPDIRTLGFSGDDPNQRADYNLYVRCQDKTGNSNVKAFNFNLCIKPGYDLSPPRITSREPLIEYVKYGATKQPITLWIDKPATCRWDVKDGEYKNLANEINCTINPEFEGWRCNEFNVSITKSENEFYVRCMNQPWLAGTAKVDKRVANGESTIIALKKSESELKIDSISPNDEIIKSNMSTAYVDLKVTTDGGMDGTAVCSYYYGDYKIEMLETGGIEHMQKDIPLTSGKKEIKLTCEDEAGNEASGKASFEVLIDTTAPKVTRAYLKGGALNIITDEDAVCVYTNGENNSRREADSCKFEFDSGSAMSGSAQEHTLTFDKKKTYYIKCRDELGNSAGGCGMIARAGEIA